MYVSLTDFQENIDAYLELAEEQTIYLMNDNGKELFVVKRAEKIDRSNPCPPSTSKPSPSPPCPASTS